MPKGREGDCLGKVGIMSILSDSGFEDDFQSSSPPSSRCPISQSPEDAERYPLVADWQQFQNYDESCFNIQRHSENEFLTNDCLVHQPQVCYFIKCLI